jgi:hypothetical protein
MTYDQIAKIIKERVDEDEWGGVEGDVERVAWACVEDVLALLRQELAHHLTERDDPCEDRGVDWPCDVARALAKGEAPAS